MAPIIFLYDKSSLPGEPMTMFYTNPLSVELTQHYFDHFLFVFAILDHIVHVHETH